jgi:hypothetical protein
MQWIKWRGDAGCSPARRPSKFDCDPSSAPLRQSGASPRTGTLTLTVIHIHGYPENANQLLRPRFEGSAYFNNTVEDRAISHCEGAPNLETASQ